MRLRNAQIEIRNSTEHTLRAPFPVNRYCHIVILSLGSNPRTGNERLPTNNNEATYTERKVTVRAGQQHDNSLRATVHRDS